MGGLRRGKGVTESRAPAERERIEERDRSRTGGEPAEFAETPDESGDESGDEEKIRRTSKDRVAAVPHAALWR